MSENIALKLLSEKRLDSKIGIIGSIRNVLNAQISALNAEKCQPARTGYSLGLGALGEDFDRVSDKFGELCTTNEVVGVLTAGRDNHPEIEHGVDKYFFTPFNVSLGRDFPRIYSFTAEYPVSMGDIYSELFKQAEKLPDYKGILGVSAILQIINFNGSLVKWSPLKGSLPECSKIIDPDRFENWFRTGPEEDKRGHIAVSVGAGIDREKAQSFPAESLGRIFYVHPANKGSVRRQLHNHCFILNQYARFPEEIEDYNSAVRNLLIANEIIDIKHILDDSSFIKGFLAVNLPQEIIGTPDIRI